MSSGTLFQVLFNLMFAAGFVAIWIRLNKPAKDDPRLSRGLQLLQSKIAILEDLSDQVERQVQQVAQLMEVKTKDLQRHIEKSDDQIRQIETATSKSLEVARIFQDRIPHEEMMDRKSTLKYVKAARLANKGMSIDEIAEQVDLSRGELEMVTKVNRDNLQFSEADLPEWAKEIANLGDGREFDMEPDSAPPILENTMAESQPLMRVNDRSVNSNFPDAKATFPERSGFSSGGSNRLEPLDQLGRKFREAFENGLIFDSENSGQIEEAQPQPQRPLDRTNAEKRAMETPVPFRPRVDAEEILNRNSAKQDQPIAQAQRLTPQMAPPPQAAPVLQATREPQAFNRAAALASKQAGGRLIQRVVFPNVNQ